MPGLHHKATFVPFLPPNCPEGCGKKYWTDLRRKSEVLAVFDGTELATAETDVGKLRRDATQPSIV
jgi:hypothetical protein